MLVKRISASAEQKQLKPAVVLAGKICFVLKEEQGIPIVVVNAQINATMAARMVTIAVASAQMNACMVVAATVIVPVIAQLGWEGMIAVLASIRVTPMGQRYFTMHQAAAVLASQVSPVTTANKNWMTAARTPTWHVSMAFVREIGYPTVGADATMVGPAMLVTNQFRASSLAAIILQKRVNLQQKKM